MHVIEMQNGVKLKLINEADEFDGSTRLDGLIPNCRSCALLVHYGKQINHLHLFRVKSPLQYARKGWTAFDDSKWKGSEDETQIVVPTVSEYCLKLLFCPTSVDRDSGMEWHALSNQVDVCAGVSGPHALSGEGLVYNDHILLSTSTDRTRKHVINPHFFEEQISEWGLDSNEIYNFIQYG